MSAATKHKSIGQQQQQLNTEPTKKLNVYIAKKNHKNNCINIFVMYKQNVIVCGSLYKHQLTDNYLIY
jgi:hypothetical protein